MNLSRLIERFRSEDRCREYLEGLRWPDGVRCPRCGNASVARIEKRDQWECNDASCRYQFSVTARTAFHDSHLPLWKWFLAIYLVGQSDQGISAKQLQGTLDVSYKTAWYLRYRSRAVMGNRSGDSDEAVFRFRDALLQLIDAETVPGERAADGNRTRVISLEG